MARKGVGTIVRDQQGISLFEILIVLLIIALIAVSCIVTIRKISSDSGQRYNTYEGIKSSDYNE